MTAHAIMHALGIVCLWTIGIIAVATIWGEVVPNMDRIIRALWGEPILPPDDAA